METTIENKEILIHLAQAHESFRKLELESLAELSGHNVKFSMYNDNV